MNVVWVIEIKDGKLWLPCAGAQLARKDAIRERDYDWRFNYPNDKFRVRKYVAAIQQGKDKHE